MSSIHAEYILFSFKNVNDAAKALYKLKDEIKARLIPLPPEIDAGCGNSLRIEAGDFDRAIELLSREDYDKVYTFSHKDGKREIEEYVF